MIGYWLDQKMEGKGIMIWLVKVVVDFGFFILNLNCIVI